MECTFTSTLHGCTIGFTSCFWLLFSLSRIHVVVLIKVLLMILGLWILCHFYKATIQDNSGRVLNRSFNAWVIVCRVLLVWRKQILVFVANTIWIAFHSLMSLLLNFVSVAWWGALTWCSSLIFRRFFQDWSLFCTETLFREIRGILLWCFNNFLGWDLTILC